MRQERLFTRGTDDEIGEEAERIASRAERIALPYEQSVEALQAGTIARVIDESSEETDQFLRRSLLLECFVLPRKPLKEESFEVRAMNKKTKEQQKQLDAHVAIGVQVYRGAKKDLKKIAREAGMIPDKRDSGLYRGSSSLREASGTLNVSEKTKHKISNNLEMLRSKQRALALKSSESVLDKAGVNRYSNWI